MRATTRKPSTPSSAAIGRLRRLLRPRFAQHAILAGAWARFELRLDQRDQVGMAPL